MVAPDSVAPWLSLRCGLLAVAEALRCTLTWEGDWLGAEGTAAASTPLGLNVRRDKLELDLESQLSFCIEETASVKHHTSVQCRKKRERDWSPQWSAFLATGSWP